MGNVNHRPVEEVEAQWLKFKRPANGTMFRHYKGGLYEIVATGFMETTEEPVVVYRSPEHGAVWVRTAENFFEEITVDGTLVRRFEMAEGGKQ